MAEQAVLDLVPLRRAGRIVAYADGQSRLVGQLLQFDFPEPNPRAVGASAVGGDHQGIAFGVSLASHRLAPAANGVDGEFRGVVIDADADATGVRADVVDSVGNGFAELLVDEVVHVDLVWTALRTIVAAAVLVGADQFLLLRVDRDHRLTGGLKGFDLCVDMFELSVPVDMMAALQALAVDLAAVAETFEQLRNPARRNAMPYIAQRQREFGVALGHPHERSHRIAQRRRFEQTLEVFQQRRVRPRERRASAARSPNPRPRGIERPQILQATIDRAACDPGRPRRGADPAVASRASLGRREQTPLLFVQTCAHGLETAANRCFINHAVVIPDSSETGNP
jgi:hypothetical protein